MKEFIAKLEFLFVIVSVLMSWIVNGSFWWALFHAIVWPVYIPYWMIQYTSLMDWISELVVI